MTKANLIAPYGGKLVNLMVEGREREELLHAPRNCPPSKFPCARYATWNCWQPAVFRR